MSLNSQAFSENAARAGKIKHLYLYPSSPTGGQEYAPSVYLEARVDFADVRSGCHMTYGISSVLDLVPFDGDLLWTRDMVRTVDPAALQTSAPPQAKLRRLPEFVNEEFFARIETQYLTYLLRYTELRIYRNFVLNAYSQPGESRQEFQDRCLEVFNDAFRGDMDTVHEIMNRRLERIEQRYLRQDKTGEFESDRRMAQARSKLHALAEKMTELFLEKELSLEEKILVPRLPDPARPDLDQSLEALEIDVRLEIQRLIHSYREKVTNIDEYIVHLNLRDLHLVRTCILWIPEGTALQ
jgi:hypothetical protein